MTAPPRALVEKYERLLRESGHVDIEYAGGLRQEETCEPQHALERQRDAQWLLHGTFRSRFDRQVWELHCDGQGVRQIGVAFGVSKSKISLSLQESKARLRRVADEKKTNNHRLRRNISRVLIDDALAAMARLITGDTDGDNE